MFIKVLMRQTAVVVIGVLSVTASQAAGQLVCPSGSYIDRSTDEGPQPESVSVALTILEDGASEVLLGSRNNPAIGTRQLEFDTVVRESDGAVTGFDEAESDEGPYWAYYPDDNTLIVSLDDIIVRGDQCVDMSSESQSASVEDRGYWTEKLLLVFDNHCYRTNGEYEEVVKAASFYQYQELSPEITNMLRGQDSEYGSAYLVERDEATGIAIMLAASVPNACSVASKGIPVDGLRSQLIESFQLRDLYVDRIGMQVSEIYEIDPLANRSSTPDERNVIVLTYPKNQEEPMVSIGYVPRAW